MNNYFVYMVRCVDGTLYTGITSDIDRRITEHNGEDSLNKKGAKYTRMRRPVELVYMHQYDNRSSASKEEYRIKQLSKQQKEVFIVRAKINTK